MNRSGCFKYWLAAVLLGSAFFSQAQEEKYLCITGGAAIGMNGFGEIGLAKKIEGNDRHGSMSVVTYTVEFKPGPRTIIAPKIGAWVWSMSPLTMGVNLAYYTDFNKGTLMLRPEGGIGWYFGKLVYGYNAPLTNKDFPGVNRHQVSVSFLLVLKEIKKK